jgi:hypothetical protein
MITNDWLLSLTPAILEYINISMPQEDSVISRLFSVRNSGNYMERVGTSGGINSATWLEYRMGGQVGGDSPSPLFYKDFTRKDYPLDIFAELALLETSPLNVLQDAASAVGLSAFQRREEDAASVFMNAFSASFVGPDNVALCSASHPVTPGSATVQANRGTTALTADAVRDTRTAMRKFKDDRNNPIMIMPDTLLVPPDLEDTAIRIVNSDGLPGETCVGLADGLVFADNKEIYNAKNLKVGLFKS